MQKPWVSKTLKKYWADNREEIVNKMRNTETATGIDAKQTIDGERDPEGYRDYQREYQRQYRKKNPEYYKRRYKRDRKLIRLDSLLSQLNEVIACLEYMHPNKKSYFDTLDIPVSAKNTFVDQQIVQMDISNTLTSWDHLATLKWLLLNMSNEARSYREKIIKERYEDKYSTGNAVLDSDLQNG